MKKITRTIRGYTFDWYSDRELLEMFPEADIPSVFVERQEEYDQRVQIIKKLLEKVEKEPSCNIPAYEALIEKFHIRNLLETERHISRLKRLISLAEGKHRESLVHEDFEERKSCAKNFPIYELARSQIDLKSSGKNFVGLCPFHTEKTPSFYLYTETNSFYCFGCQTGGDVITLTMHIYGIGFTDAVTMLQ